MLLIAGVAAVAGRGRGTSRSADSRLPAPPVVAAAEPPLVERPEPARASAVRLLADEAYAPALDQLLASATRSIDVTMFSCVLPADARPTHPVRRILDRLVERKKAGVQVRVVFDHGIPAGKLKEGEEAPSDNGARYLADHGIDVRWDEDARTTHTKSLVVDGRWCVVGSTNWSYSALSKNREQSVLVDSVPLADELTVRFTALWKVSAPLR